MDIRNVPLYRNVNKIVPNLINIVTAFHILEQIYSANHATFPKQIYTITVYISGNLTFKVLSKYAAEACKEYGGRQRG